MKKKVLIEGMSCGHCVKQVKEALSEIKGVSNVDVNLDGKYAILEASGEVKDEELKTTISEVGYKVVGIEAL